MSLYAVTLFLCLSLARRGRGKRVVSNHDTMHVLLAWSRSPLPCPWLLLLLGPSLVPPSPPAPPLCVPGPLSVSPRGLLAPDDTADDAGPPAKLARLPLVLRACAYGGDGA